MKIVGHSLGAHVAGNAGFHTKNGKFGRITGLDPAYPVIHKLATIDDRLDSSDAVFVDIIHSCGGVLGFFDPLGHADFYPNAGVPVQPGCCCVAEITGKININFFSTLKCLSIIIRLCLLKVNIINYIQ